MARYFWASKAVALPSGVVQKASAAQKRQRQRYWGVGWDMYRCARVIFQIATDGTTRLEKAREIPIGSDPYIYFIYCVIRKCDLTRQRLVFTV